MAGKKKKKKDQHKSNRLVRLGEDVFQAMRSLAEENDRPLTREIRQALIAWLEARQKWPPQPPQAEEEGGGTP